MEGGVPCQKLIYSVVVQVILHLGQYNPQDQYRLGDEGSAGSPVEKDFRVLADG